MRVIDETGSQLGIFDTAEAIRLARERNLDLIEVAAKADPPVARILDYGKYQYQQAKKELKTKGKTRRAELKEMRIKLGTGAHDLKLKALRIDEFLEEGNKVRINMVLRGREKYLNELFLKQRFKEFFGYIQKPYAVSEEMKKGPHGLIMTIDPVKS